MVLTNISLTQENLRRIEDNVWIRQQTVRRAAKKIAKNFFPKPVRKDIYWTCREAGSAILSQYNQDKHGDLWAWVFLNMLARVDTHMCAMMIFVVCQSEIPWQQKLGASCIKQTREARLLASKAKAYSTPATSTAPTSR